jgi:hypothetical protein
VEDTQTDEQTQMDTNGQTWMEGGRQTDSKVIDLISLLTKLRGVDRYTYRQQGDIISLLLFSSK